MRHQVLFSLAWFTLVAGAPAGAQAPADELPPRQQERIDGPPVVSAAAWAIADAQTGKVLWGANEDAHRVMASTTKIMTAVIVFDLAVRQPDVLAEVVTVTERADKTSGSTADIREGEKYSVGDLLYGLLLPSGNDAAVALAEHFGPRLAREKSQDEEPADSLEPFVAGMNRRAKELNLTETKYLDPHGNSRNQSSARNLIALTHHAMKNPLFCRYVQTRRHQCEAAGKDDKKRAVVWNNTNRLLGIEGYDGVKTGTTGAAGSCLVARGRYQDDALLVVVLGCTSNDSRYVDARNLFRWAWQQRARPAQ
jgi:D-alanyl-D-alanine carboxypeptidase (penicillin-binding protein 5/6)